MMRLGTIPTDVMCLAGSFLEAREVAAWGAACRSLRGWVCSGTAETSQVLWLDLVSRELGPGCHEMLSGPPDAPVVIASVEETAAAAAAAAAGGEEGKEGGGGGKVDRNLLQMIGGGKGWVRGDSASEGKVGDAAAAAAATAGASAGAAVQGDAAAAAAEAKDATATSTPAAASTTTAAAAAGGILPTNDPYRGIRLYEEGVRLRQRLAAAFEVVQGAVDKEVGGCEMLVCPCLRDPRHYTPYGAQGAIRRSGGAALEAAIRENLPAMDVLSVEVVPGGNAAKYVAMTVTQPPERMYDDRSFANHSNPNAAKLEAIKEFLRDLHRKVLAAARAGGYNGVALPTLCTGGIGINAKLVCNALADSVLEDFVAHRGQQQRRDVPALRIRLACFEREHFFLAQIAKMNMLAGMYSRGRRRRSCSRSRSGSNSGSAGGGGGDGKNGEP